MAAQRLPDEREAAEGAVAAAANAAGLLGDADLLAAAGRYGSALSLAVVAFEEAVKARGLGAIAAAAAQGREPGFSEDTLRKIIYSGHQARHEAGCCSTSRLPFRRSTSNSCSASPGHRAKLACWRSSRISLTRRTPGNRPASTPTSTLIRDCGLFQPQSANRNSGRSTPW